MFLQPIVNFENGNGGTTSVSIVNFQSCELGEAEITEAIQKARNAGAQRITIRFIDVDGHTRQVYRVK